MPTASFVQTTFHGGEWSQAAQGRMDDPRYKTALNVCLNAFTTEEGAWVRRPGTRYVMNLSGAGRVFPFALPDTAPYCMVFTNNALNFIDGGVLLPQVLGTNYAFNTSNDWQPIRVVQADNIAILLNGNIPQVLSVAALPTPIAPAVFNNLVEADFQDGPYMDIPTDGTLLTPGALGPGTIGITLSGGSGQVSFVPSDVGRMIRIQSIPQVWSPVTVYHDQDKVFYLGDVYQYNDPSHGGAPASVIPPPSNPLTYFSTTPPPGFYGWQLLPQQSLWTWGTVSQVLSPTSGTLTLKGPNLLYTHSTPYFRMGLYSASTGYPTCGCYHEGRLWLAGAQDNRIDGSMNAVPLPDPTYGNLVTESKAIFIFSPTDLNGVVSDANAISALFLSEETNNIYWLVPDQQGILGGTRGGEWLVQATNQNNILTPTSIQAHRYTKVKCANILPMKCNLTLVFVQLYQRKLIEYFSDVFSGKMIAPNLTEMAKHIPINFIQEITYQQETNPILWARDGAGGLIGVSYKRESLYSREKPDIAAWHRHTLGSGRIIESICTAGNPTGAIDALYMVTSDGSTRWVEMLSDTLDENISDPSQYNFLDGSTRVTNYTDNGAIAATMTLAGLGYLAGETVTVMAGGLDCGEYTVASDGTITVDYGDGFKAGPRGLTDHTGTQLSGGGAYLLTSAYVHSFAGGMPIYVGYSYTSRGQLVRPQSPADTGARTGPGFSKKRRVGLAGILAVNSQGISIGTSYTANMQMYPLVFKDPTETALPPNVLYSGVFWSGAIGDDFSFDGMLAWEITRPYPCTIAAAGAWVSTEEMI